MTGTVIDTNVFISSFFGGNPRKVIDLWKTGRITLRLSKDILDEYIEVLQRLGLKDSKEIEELLGLFAGGHHILFTMHTKKLDIVKKDPDDNKFIECALSLDTKVIVSGDKALLEVNDYMGIRILSPKEFLAGVPEK